MAEATTTDSAHANDAHQHSTKSYFVVWIILLACTVLTVLTGRTDLSHLFPSANIVLALTIAVIKASLVVWYFMHVKYQSRLTKLTVATGLFFLAVLLGLMLVDYGSKGFTPMPPPTDSESVIGGSPEAR